jgi:hypothetical protein
MKFLKRKSSVHPKTNTYIKYKLNEVEITYKTDKNTNIFVILLVSFVILLILFVNSLLKQQSTQLPAMKPVISHENL